jgi:cytochrome c-type biogenesis protein CcmH
VALVEKLRNAVSKRPDDLKGHEFLVRYEANIGEYNRAYRAKIRAIEIKKDQATPDDYGVLVNLMVMAAGGYVSPEAETVLQRMLAADPENGTGLYFTGLMFAQTGRPDIAFDIWSGQLDKSKPGDPWLGPIRAQIMEAAAIAGVEYRMPDLPTAPARTPDLAGPSADDIRAASEMSDEDRQQFIKTMVARLSARLESNGGSPQEWAQLFGALAVLGDTEKAAEFWELAQQAYAGDDAALATIGAAAKQAGVAN